MSAKKRHALRALALAVALGAQSTGAGAQSAPSVGPMVRARAILAKEQQLLAADGGGLWGKRLDNVPMLFVMDDHLFATVDPKQKGYVARGAFWEGPFSTDIAPENMTREWAGRDWAMVTLPLPDDDATAVRILIHEAWHVIQPAVVPSPPFEETTPGSALLDEPAGRLWLQLEWKALAAALKAADVSVQTSEVRHALLFRQARLSLTSSAECDRERLLEQIEGLAEYTAWTLSNSKSSEFASKLLDEAPQRPSFIRSFPYYTGPAYAMLLDLRSPGWIARLKPGQDLQSLLASTVPEDPQREPLNWDRVERIAQEYDVEDVRRKERARWPKRQRELASLRARFVEGPTLRIRPYLLRITYDPREQISLGADGALMANVRWRAESGAALEAPHGALLTPAGNELRVPLGDARLAPGDLSAPLHVAQPDWTLTLPSGWQLKQIGTSWLATP